MIIQGGANILKVVHLDHMASSQVSMKPPNAFVFVCSKKLLKMDGYRMCDFDEL